MYKKSSAVMYGEHNGTLNDAVSLRCTLLSVMKQAPDKLAFGDD